MKRLADLVLVAYQRALSPILAGLGCGCRFHPTCSAYARAAFRSQPPLRALRLTLWRLARCGPWNPGGVE